MESSYGGGGGREGDGVVMTMTREPKSRLRWTTDLHDRFVDTVTKLGGPNTGMLDYLASNTTPSPQNTELNKESKESAKAIVLKAFIHCEGCSDKISKCLKGLDGVERIAVDRENNKVIVRGEVMKDPVKVLERLQKKYSKNVELITPKPKPEKQKKDPEKKEEAPLKTVVLKMYIHCQGCASDVKRKIEKMEGVQSVQLNAETSHVIVKGEVESTKLVEYVKKRLGKHAEIIKEDKKKEAKKEERDNEKGKDPIIMFNYPPQYSTQYLYPNQTFSDENVFACSIM